MLKNYRKTKILATIGPSSEKISKIEKLALAGADAFRINSSHSNRDKITQYVKNIRKVEDKINKPLGILLDLQGPKLRIGNLKNDELILKKGQKVFLKSKTNNMDIKDIPITDDKIFQSIKKNDPIFLDDGKIVIKVIKSTKNKIESKVISGGILKSNKGINLPGTILKNSPITITDKKNIKLAIKLGIDWIALSFVQSPRDIKEIKKLCNQNISIMAKIEKPSALNHIEEITRTADGIMIARGDLGIELPIFDVPGWQKKIIREARDQGKPVVVSTQMLE